VDEEERKYFCRKFCLEASVKIELTFRVFNEFLALMSLGGNLKYVSKILEGD
jgi:hypothetical protein